VDGDLRQVEYLLRLRFVQREDKDESTAKTPEQHSQSPLM
jgi:hypothetical protein